MLALLLFLLRRQIERSRTATWKGERRESRYISPFRDVYAARVVSTLGIVVPFQTFAELPRITPNDVVFTGIVVRRPVKYIDAYLVFRDTSSTLIKRPATYVLQKRGE